MLAQRSELPKLPAVKGTVNPLKVERKNNQVTVSNGRVSMTFDNKSGQVIAWNYNGQPILYPGKGAKYDNFRWIENEAPYTSKPYNTLDGKHPSPRPLQFW